MLVAIAGGAAPLHQQVYEGVRAAITAGRLKPGARLPAARVLAGDLGVSRNTVLGALAQLRAEGYLEMRERSGTFVTRTLPDRTPDRGIARESRHRDRNVSSAPPRTLSQRGASLVRLGSVASSESPALEQGAPRAFGTGVPALAEFPWALWSRITARRLRGGMHALGGYGASVGYAPLRTAIAAHVAATRGTTCHADQVIVTGGAQQAIDLIARLLLDPGDVVWMENPGYPRARARFAAASARVVPVPVDAEGLDVQRAVRAAPDVRLAYVTPSHQYPTGVVMSAARRLALLDWIARTGAWIVEDDYDSEFRYASRPLAALHGLDTNGCVLYVGTFSKTLFPSLRLGYVIVPEALVDAFATMRTVADRQTATLEQAVLAEFLADGHYARHVRRMRVLYEERRDVVLAAAPNLLGDRLSLTGGDAGMHLVGLLPPGVSDVEVSERAREHGVTAPPLSRYAVRPLARDGLLLGYAGFSPRVLRAALRRLADAL